MKKISLFAMLALLCVTIFMSCEEEDTFPFETKGATIAATNVGFFNFYEINTTTFDFNVSSLGEAISSVNVMKSYNGGTPVLHGTITQTPVAVSITAAQAVEGLGISVDDLQLGDEIVFTFEDVQTGSGTYPSATSATAKIACLSPLAGTHSYTTSDYFCAGDAVTGEVTWAEVGAGVYEIDDWAYGSYQACYGGPAQSWGTLQLSDVCNQLTILGVDNYGDTWSFSSITVDGANLTLGWTNTYGEIGTTIITRTDGAEWPPLFQ